MCVTRWLEIRFKPTNKDSHLMVTVRKWALRDSNPRPSACKADALNQLS